MRYENVRQLKQTTLAFPAIEAYVPEAIFWTVYRLLLAGMGMNFHWR
jgi:hypothetical protein